MSSMNINGQATKRVMLMVPVSGPTGRTATAQVWAGLVLLTAGSGVCMPACLLACLTYLLSARPPTGLSACVSKVLGDLLGYCFEGCESVS